MVTRPDIDLGLRGFELTREQRSVLVDAMSRYPAQSSNPVYDAERYPDDRVKYLLPGLERVLPREHWSVYNKVGRAYGFSVENAYVVDEWSGRSFYLTAVVYTNPNATVNDGDYAYSEVADPFFVDLGEAVARRLGFGD